jgi:YopX protein
MRTIELPKAPTELLYPKAKGYADGGKHTGIEIIGNIYENPELMK